jgi:hypothetical protein
MGRVLRRHLPVVVFAVLALVIAAVGVAFGGSNATTPKTVKRIVTQKINSLAPGLSVAHAGSADSAVHAGNATDATNATRVNGANVCAKTINVSTNDEDHPLCENGPLIVSARCNNASSTTEGFINVSSTRADAWAFGTATDGSTVTSVDANALPTHVTVVDITDADTAPASAKGGSATLSVGAPDGSHVSGIFSIRVDHTGAGQGSCFATIGSTSG